MPTMPYCTYIFSRGIKHRVCSRARPFQGPSAPPHASKRVSSFTRPTFAVVSDVSSPPTSSPPAIERRRKTDGPVKGRKVCVCVCPLDRKIDPCQTCCCCSQHDTTFRAAAKQAHRRAPMRASGSAAMASTSAAVVPTTRIRVERRGSRGVSRSRGREGLARDGAHRRRARFPRGRTAAFTQSRHRVTARRRAPRPPPGPPTARFGSASTAAGRSRTCTQRSPARPRARLPRTARSSCCPRIPPTTRAPRARAYDACSRR